jgi:hypothetical protein
MKESSCHDPKMEAYYKVVQCLEDRFDDLELNHITCKYNEAVNELAKITLGRTTNPQTSSLATSTSPLLTTRSQDKKATSRPSLQWDRILPKDPTPLDPQT